MKIDKKAMTKVLHGEHAFSELFVAYLLTRNSRYEEDLVDQLFNSSEKRLARIPFVLTGQGRQQFNSLSITEAFLGALTGFFLAIMFTLRERRRQRPAFVAYSVEHMYPNWAHPTKTATHMGSQSVDPHRQAESGPFVFNTPHEPNLT